MMYPWKNKGGGAAASRHQQQQQSARQQQLSQQRATAVSPITIGSGYTTTNHDEEEQQPPPSSSSSSPGRSTTGITSAGDDCTSINSQNPHDNMMDSVFHSVNSCLFSNDEVTVSHNTGGYLHNGGSGSDDDDDDNDDDVENENIEISSNRMNNNYETRPDSNEQGFEMQNDNDHRRHHHRNNSMNWKPFSSSSARSIISSCTTVTSPNNSNNLEDEDDNDDENRSNIVRLRSKNATPGFFATLMAEFCNPRQDWYSVHDTVTGRRLDFITSFAPSPTLSVLLVKLVSTILVLGTIAFSMWDFYLLQDDKNQLHFWLSYFTNWSLCLAAIYQLLSLSNTTCPTRGMAFAPPAEHVTGRVKWTWIFFSLALYSQVLGALMFWIAYFQSHHYQQVWTTSSGISSLQENPADSTESLSFYYLTIVPHTLTLMAVAVDGLVVNRIPLRLMHWWGWILGFNVLYIVWTVVRSLVLMNNNDASSIPVTEYGYLYTKYHDVMNNTSSLVSLNDTAADATDFNLDNYTMVDSINMDNDAESSSTAVYNGGMLNWQDGNWPLAFIQSLILCFVISPILYIMLWTLSLYKWPCCCKQDRRRYVQNHLHLSIQEIGGGGGAKGGGGLLSSSFRGRVENDQRQQQQQQTKSSWFGAFW